MRLLATAGAMILISGVLVTAQTAKEISPLVRVPEAAVRAVAIEAANADGDVKGFQSEFAARIAKLCPGCNYQVLPLVPLALTRDLTAGAYGPISGFYISASDLIRRKEPILNAAWTEGVTVLVVPVTIMAPNIERVVVLREGKVITPLSGSLRATELGNQTGAKATLNAGKLVYPLSAFEPGASVQITLVRRGGDPLVTTLSRADIFMLR